MVGKSANSYLKSIAEAARFLQTRLRIGEDTIFSRLAVVLGSGLSGFDDVLEIESEIPFSQIPHFPRPSVEGHSGRLLAGRLDGRAIWCMKGRVHYYEGYDMRQVTFPVRAWGRLGVNTLIVTNAAGGIKSSLRPGDLMLISDHLSSFIPNPLRGENLSPFGPRFPDMREAYSRRLRKLAARCAAKLKMKLQEGIYVAVSGPSYESPAEIQMFKKLGGDAVGMSTVAEVITACHMGISCLGISVITNLAAGINRASLSHQEVLEVGERVKPKLTRLLRAISLEVLSP